MLDLPQLFWAFSAVAFSFVFRRHPDPELVEGEGPLYLSLPHPHSHRPRISGCPILRALAKGGMQNFPEPAVAVAFAFV